MVKKVIEKAKELKEKLYDGASIYVDNEDVLITLETLLKEDGFIYWRQYINCYQMVRFGSVLSEYVNVFTKSTGLYQNEYILEYQISR